MIACPKPSCPVQWCQMKPEVKPVGDEGPGSRGSDPKQASPTRARLQWFDPVALKQASDLSQSDPEVI